MFFHKKSHIKLKLLFTTILIFSIIYTLLDDEHFKGVNILHDTLETEIATQKIEKKVDKLEKFISNNIEAEVENENENETTSLEKIKEVKNVIDKKNIVQPFYIKYFDRLYFSVISACLLGYGDIYPYTFYCKLFTMIQALITVSIIVY
jgi:hypothetical protein